MKTAAVALLLAAAASAQKASDITYEWFPPTGIACPNDGATADLIGPTALLQDAAFKARTKTPREKSAANISSGKCQKLKGIPYYSTEAYQENGELAGTLSFAYDSRNQTIYFCLAQGRYSNNGSGYPDRCTEV